MKQTMFTKLGVTLIASAGVFLASTGVHASLTPSSSNPLTDMVDLSSWQSNLSASDYQTLADNGVKAVTIKASEGTGYINPYLSQQVKYAQQAGLSINFYHFARFTSTGAAQQEAQNMINAVQQVTDSKNVVMVVDFEASELGSLSKAANNANLAAFDQVINNAGYNKTDLYTMSSWVGTKIDLNDQNKGWIANWPSTPTGNKYPDANAWQWASDYRFPGESSDLDVSQLNNDFYLNSSTGSSNHTATTPSDNSDSSSTANNGNSGDGTAVIIPGPKPETNQYSASRSQSVKLIWRKSMGRYAFHTTKGARYSKHLGIRYDYNKYLPNATWYTDGHEKLYKKTTGRYNIYYHVRSHDNKHGGWIWRGYLTRGVNPNQN
ncbi:GH25 family lysozyme [Lentilactobacillus sp. Marseille-Q4993]|uniref:GH25 family lysozyme n=1 Tax=Lentilactobacillus sp. Marseille-Q4993 TaxID=3039492 RepID=UPI0024BBFC3A|nr:GH25 family lysozyme [Lentilactobacillus sp. Marseille-Q4993]